MARDVRPIARSALDERVSCVDQLLNQCGDVAVGEVHWLCRVRHQTVVHDAAMADFPLAVDFDEIVVVRALPVIL